MRRIAVNTAIYNNKCIEPTVIELVGDRVEHFFQLKEEISMTEWIGGEVVLQVHCGSSEPIKMGRCLAKVSRFRAFRFWSSTIRRIFIERIVFP